MKVECTQCNHWHDFTPTALVLIIQEMQSGELLVMGGGGVSTKCLMTAFTKENVARITRKYPRGLIIARQGDAV